MDICYGYALTVKKKNYNKQFLSIHTSFMQDIETFSCPREISLCGRNKNDYNWNYSSKLKIPQH